MLGPESPQLVVDEIEKATGLGAAIVDVNDLKAVKIVAASPRVNRSVVTQALIDNPAGECRRADAPGAGAPP